MNLKLIFSMLCLLSIGALFMGGAIAQPSAAPICAKSVQGDLSSALISVRLSDRDSTLVAVKTNTTGNVTECKVVKSGGSVHADKTSCDWVAHHWRSLERCQDH